LAASQQYAQAKVKISAASSCGEYLANEQSLRGLIIKAQSGFFTVETGLGFTVCQLRGKLKQGKATGDIAAIGDQVRITVLTDGSGVIEEVEERERAIVRLDPRPQGDYQQVLLANADQAVFVFACAHPNPRLRMLDRFLVIAEKQKIPAVIVANKIDLVDDPKEIFGLYETIGYRVLYTSTKTNAGIEELKSILAGTASPVSAFAGPSGAGKSSLLNAMQPGLGLAVNEISKVMDKGKHTTVTRQLFPLAGGGYIADTRAGNRLRCGILSRKRSTRTSLSYASLCSIASSATARTPMNRTALCAARWMKVKSILNDMNPICDFARVKNDDD
jgi:ribosome biogenesis GTPase